MPGAGLPQAVRRIVDAADTLVHAVGFVCLPFAPPELIRRLAGRLHAFAMPALSEETVQESPV